MRTKNDRRNNENGFERSLKHTAAVVLTVVVVFVTIVSTPLIAKYVYEERGNVNVTYSNKLADSFKLLEHRAVLNEDAGDGTYKLLSGEPNLVLENIYEYALIPKTVIPKDPHVTVSRKTKIPAYIYVEVIESDAMKALTSSVKIPVEPLSNGAASVWTVPASSESIRRLRMEVVPAPAESVTRPYGTEDWTDEGNGVYTFSLSAGRSFTVETDSSCECSFSTLPRLEYTVNDAAFEPLLDGEDHVTGPLGGLVYVFKKGDTNLVDDSSAIDDAPIYVLKGSSLGTNTTNGEIRVIDKVPIENVADVRLTMAGYMLQQVQDGDALEVWSASFG